MDNPQDIKVLSLCTGYGGLDIGLSRAIQRPLRIVAVEIEAYALANLVEKTDQGKMAIEALWPDLKTFPAEKFRGCFDFLTAGIPCQPWSVAGKQEGIKDERWLWDDIYQIIIEVQPTCIFLEEVPGFVRGGGLGYVLSDLAKAGYDAEWGNFSAAEVGAPHKRERLFILAKSIGIGRGGRDNGELGGQGRPLQTPGPGELEHPISEQGRLHATGRDIDPETRSASETLADTECTEPRAGVESIESQTPKHRGDRLANGSEGLADTDLSRTAPGGENRGMGRQPQSTTKYPARPGQEQYEWEEPRTVKPQLGRAANGPSRRVDRLRLLGNGVVPDQAELAFRTLIDKFT